MALKKFFGEAFARFELSCGFGWTENGPLSAIELVHDTKGQRKFRADDCEVGLQTDGKLSDAERSGVARRGSEGNGARPGGVAR